MKARFVLFALVAAFAAILGPTVAMAATTTPIDTTGVVAQIGEINTAVLAIGGALLAAAAVAVGITWAKGSIFS